MEQFAVRKENPLEYKPIGLLLVEFAVPATIAVLVNAVYNIVDQIFVGNMIGYVANGATGIIFPITVVGWGMSLFFGDGIAVIAYA